MGNSRVTVRGLLVASVDPDRNLLMLKGAVPGSRNGLLTVRHADLEAAAKAYADKLAAVPATGQGTEAASSRGG